MILLKKLEEEKKEKKNIVDPLNGEDKSQANSV